MTRSRYIPKKEKIAALLVELLPEGMRLDLYKRKVPAEDILRMFEWDHYPRRFVDGGSNEWHNIRPMRPMDHLIKTAKDKAELAKTDRLHGRTKNKPKKKIPGRKIPTKTDKQRVLDSR